MELPLRRGFRGSAPEGERRSTSRYAHTRQGTLSRYFFLIGSRCVTYQPSSHEMIVFTSIVWVLPRAL